MDFHTLKVTLPPEALAEGVIRNDTPTIELDGETVQGLFSIERLNPLREMPRVKLLLRASKLELLYTDNLDREHEPVPAPVMPEPSDFEYRDAVVTILFDRAWERRHRDNPEVIKASGYDAQLLVNGKPMKGVIGFEIKSKPRSQPLVEIEMLYSSLETSHELPASKPVNSSNPCPDVTFLLHRDANDVVSIATLQIHDDLEPLRSVLKNALAANAQVDHVKLKFDGWTLEFESTEPVNLPRFSSEPIGMHLLRFAYHVTDPSGRRLTQFKLEFYGWSLEIASDTPFGTFAMTDI
jgi:hypothetical protein